MNFLQIGIQNFQSYLNVVNIIQELIEFRFCFNLYVFIFQQVFDQLFLTWKFITQIFNIEFEEIQRSGTWNSTILLIK